MECNDKRIFVQVLKMRLAGDTAVSSYYIMKGVRFIYIMCYDICLKDKGDSMGKVTIKILGIGDGGNTIIRHMLQHRLHGVEDMGQEQILYWASVQQSRRRRKSVKE